MSIERCQLPDGRRAVRKRHRDAIGARGEAAGLAAIAAVAGAPPVPELIACEGATLLLADLGAGAASPAAWERFAQQLAALHRHHGPAFGFAVTTCCGPTPQPNPWTPDGHAFVAEHRLRFLARACRDAGALPASVVREVERIADRLGSLVPTQPPSLLHGDLWHGNAHAAADGRIHLIDPACWYGWAECDIAMTRLFGGFPQLFYDAYLAAHPLPAGWQQRCELHNLYHLMNHALLFGGGYAREAAAVARRWA
ncbi:MAG: fructosamine kinase family protein [Planctomycetota bacterium]|nr:fructosamine kinase family protein [Planctomycetota bacterium]MCX8040708.1 fructosamine kinase family protein [Planctomycetota bacterium]MDW8372323.1 fructosamine kinase family protein [Planctomycetota bacterium]